MSHLSRKELSDPCPVCGVEAFTACIPEANTQLSLDIDNNYGEARYLEYQVIIAVRRLREVEPDNLLVRAVALILNYQSKDTT